MAPSTNLLQTLTFLSLFLIYIINKVQSTSFSFDSFDPKPTNATFQGSASAYGDRLILTKLSRSGEPLPCSVGRVVYSEPVQFWEPRKVSSFETTFKFRISEHGRTIPGDGIAFFMAPVGAPIPPYSSGGNLGIFNSNGEACNLFAVEFDTKVDEWDPKFIHMGIDISSSYSRMVKQLELKNFFREMVTATITYKANTVTVVANYGVNTTKMWYQVDLSTVLPQRVQVGISGATGVQVEYNSLHFWNFSSTIANPYDEM